MISIKLCGANEQANVMEYSHKTSEYFIEAKGKKPYYRVNSIERL